MHKAGEVIEFPYCMNSFFTHQVPPYAKARDEWRISLTFSQIEESTPPHPAHVTQLLLL